MISKCALESVQEAALAEEPDSESQDEGRQDHEQVLAGQAAPAHGKLIEDYPLAEIELEARCVHSGRGRRQHRQCKAAGSARRSTLSEGRGSADSASRRRVGLG